MRLARSIAHPFTLIVLSIAVSAALWPGRGFLKAARASGSPSRETAASAPFRVGERLFYQVGWMNLTEAATAELKVEPRRDFYGVPVWHFQATAQTEEPLRLLMAVNDQFDSYCNASTLVTRQYELYLNEEDKRTVRRLALDDGSPEAVKVGAPEGTRDPLAMLYRLRLVNWQRTPQFLSTVYDGAHFYRVVARLAAAHDSVAVPAGQFDASRIDIEVSPEEPGARPMQLTLWLANNSAHTPVEVDAQVTVGTFKGELVRMD
jgi:hypothetical protein